MLVSLFNYLMLPLISVHIVNKIQKDDIITIKEQIICYFLFVIATAVASKITAIIIDRLFILPIYSNQKEYILITSVYALIVPVFYRIFRDIFVVRIKKSS